MHGAGGAPERGADDSEEVCRSCVFTSDFESGFPLWFGGFGTVRGMAGSGTGVVRGGRGIFATGCALVGVLAGRVAGGS